MSIKAPFNFVPLNDKVFYPDWANAISQDVPFEDGESGTITLNIKAESPIFVRNGSLNTEKEQKEADKEKNFSQWDNKYFIPGSSVKGMLRSVLEILSFGKLGSYDDNKYAVRDLNNREVYMNRITKLDKNGNKFIRCGWLQKDENGNYTISDRGEPAKVSFSDIDNMFGTNMNSFFQANGGYQPNNTAHKSAVFKYKQFQQVNAATKVYSFAKKGKRGFEKSDKGEKGIIIFTGQPGTRTPTMGRQKGRGKGSEFIFWEKELGIYDVCSRLIKDFKFAYFDHDKETNQSDDWKYWKAKLDNHERIPIFFQLDPTTKQVAHFGLSYLYKLPYEYSVGDLVKTMQAPNPDALDLAECIFGCIEDDDKKGTMLKGRIHIGHAFTTNAECLDKKSEVLSSPKASYYPLYIRQTTAGKYETFMDKTAKIAGRKRYPIQNGSVQTNPAPLIKGKQNKEVETQFFPLDKGTEFKCQISYHNLRKAELGALLSAITFHNTQGCFHSLGMGKPLGYGKVKVQIENFTAEQQKNYLIAFEQEMNAQQEKWASHKILTELVTMASPQNNLGNSQLSYMKLNAAEKQNDFTAAKKANEALNFYSELDNIKSKTITSLTAESAPTQKNTLLTVAALKQQLRTKLKELFPQTQSLAPKTNTAQINSNPPTVAETKIDIAPISAEFLQTNAVNPKKRYDMEAIVTKSSQPNFIQVFVKQGIIQNNVQLDAYKSALTVGQVIVVTVAVNTKGEVIQASFKQLKLR